MKANFLKYFSLSFFLLLLVACEDDNKDTTPPGMVSNITYEATNGGAIIRFTAPQDPDLLYIKASYVNSLGNAVFRTTSIYSNEIEIDGLSDESKEYPVVISALDAKGNGSAVAEIKVKPLRSYINMVLDSFTAEETLGGVKISWTNPVPKTVFVYLIYKNGNKENERILSSDKEEYSETVRGMENVPYDFSIIVEDFSGNKTQEKSLGQLTPKLEQKINKNTWSLLSYLSCNGNAWEGLTTNFFDDVVDVNTNPNDNSYFIITRDNNGGQLNFPMSIVIDMNKKVQMSRVKVWQRAYKYASGDGGSNENYAYYDEDNLRSFNIYVSNDLQEWNLVLVADIGQPETSAETNWGPTQKWIDMAVAGHEFILPQLSPEFRYLKFDITGNYGSSSQICGSELTIYGLDNL